MGSSEYDCQRIIQKQNVDRISNLPDEVISLILSLLPTKWAVGTSVLSKRWKYLWTSITCLDFYNHTCTFTNTNPVDFTRFVDHVIHCCNSSHIHKLVLNYPWQGLLESSVKAWVDEGIKRSVSEMDLDVYVLPLNVFSCTTLTHLTLGGCYGYDAEGVSFDLPFLKVLHLKGKLNSLMEKLISSCTVLEDLKISGPNAWDQNDTFIVSAHTLKTLRLYLNQCYSFGTEISVEAPNLECLHLSATFILYKIKGIFSSLVKAYVNIGNIYMRDDFQDVSRHFRLPKFSKMTSLEVMTCDNRFWALFPKLIRSSTKLKVLSLKQLEGDNMENDDYTWVEPKCAAKCLSLHLKEIKIEGFKGRKHELQLLAYLLGSAKVLRTLAISCKGLKIGEEIEFGVQLLKFSRVSKYCQVQFHGHSNL